MTSTGDAAATMRAFADRIDARDWDGLGELLAPGFSARYVHTGETFDRPAFLTLNREYPLVVRFAVEELVADGPRAVIRGRVSDTQGSGTWFVASFGRVDDSGLLVDLVEVWVDGASDAPEHRPA